MRWIGIYLILLFGCVEAGAHPQGFSWEASPDNSHEVSVHYPTPSEPAKLSLRTVGAAKTTDVVTLDVDAQDERNGVSIDWSPDGKALAVTTQNGQLYNFTIYRVRSGHLKAMPELPLPKSLQPKHNKSRGGPAFQKWIDRKTFEIFNNSSETEFTYHVIKGDKIRAVTAKYLGL